MFFVICRPKQRSLSSPCRALRKKYFPTRSMLSAPPSLRACKILGIDDLHFHDLRHDGVSRLFEMGKTIPQAASVSGHRTAAHHR